MSLRLTVELDDGTLCLASHACLAVVIWVRAPTPERIEKISVLQRSLVETHGYCLSLSSVPDKLPITTDEPTKRATADNMREFGHTNLGMVVLVRQGGVRATLIRTLMTGLQLLTFAPTSQRVFTQVRPSLAWLAERPGLRPTHAQALPELEAELEALLQRAYD